MKLGCKHQILLSGSINHLSDSVKTALKPLVRGNLISMTNDYLTALDPLMVRTGNWNKSNIKLGRGTREQVSQFEVYLRGERRGRR